MKTAKLR